MLVDLIVIVDLPAASASAWWKMKMVERGAWR